MLQHEEFDYLASTRLETTIDMTINMNKNYFDEILNSCELMYLRGGRSYILCDCVVA